MKRILFLLVFFLAVTIPVMDSGAATMQDYCIHPPFIQPSITPNLLLAFDNSGSMYDLQYISSSGMFCFDNSYLNTNVCSVTATTTCTTNANCPSGETCVGRYAGYFDPNRYYTSAGVSYNTDLTVGNTTFSTFTPIASLPAGCTYKTPYLCVNVTSTTTTIELPGICKKTNPVGTYCKYTDCSCYASTAASDCIGSGNSCNLPSPATKTETVYDATQFAAKGNFLNWLSSSKMDIQKQILTGGKYDPTNNLLIEESRGCVGARYVKEVPLADWITPLSPAASPITFGVRGDISADPRVPSTGGTTRIDIFNGNFNNSSCQDAVTCYSTCGDNCSNCKSSTTDCIGGTGASPQTTTWNHALSRCWQCPHVPCCPEDFTWPGDGVVITNNQECGSLTATQKLSLDPMNPMYVCLNSPSAVLSITSDTFNGCSQNSYSGPPGAFVGVCDSVPGAPTSTAYQDCVVYQFTNYCRQLQVADVVDPTSAPADTSQTGNIPSNLVDAGLMALGKPMKTFHGRVSVGSVPSGLINDFEGQIRFGTMKFNDFGSKSECGGANPNISYTCDKPLNKDGSLLLTPISNTVGDHSSGLIKGIDDIVAATWTPFSEAMYNAIGYYAMNSSTTDATVMRLNVTDFGTPADFPPTPAPSRFPCQRNNVLLITDGQSTADLNAKVIAAVSNNHPPAVAGINTYDTSLATVQTACPSPSSMGKYSGSRNLFDLAWFAQNRKISNLGTSLTDAPVRAEDVVSTYTVFSGQDASLLTADACAALGATPATATSLCQPDELMCYSANAGNGKYYLASDPASLKSALSEAFFAISGAAASGTAASVLASSEGRGANIIQALFHPKKVFDDKTFTTWAGRLLNLWYYVDPKLQSNTIREDTDQNKVENLTQDRQVVFKFDTTKSDETLAYLYTDTNGDGLADTPATPPYVKMDDVKSIWEAGDKLFRRDPATRTILTTTAAITTDSPATTSFTTANAVSLMPYLRASTENQAENIINYIRGYDSVCSGSTTHCDSDTDCGGVAGSCLKYRNRTVKKGADTGVWKLGDIVTSTPKLQSSIPLNNYFSIYSDTSYSQFTGSSTYKTSGTAYVGANDGMLHAFNFGVFQESWVGQNKQYEPARLAGADLGAERWAYIPKNVLPYLKYLTSNAYCHVFSVDAAPYVFDAAINAPSAEGCTQAEYWNCPKQTVYQPHSTALDHDKTSWRTVLIGSLRLGGACRGKNVATPCTDCVRTPGVDLNGDGDTLDTGEDEVGFSSYFALDITDENNPKLLWEFSDPELGYSTSGPAFIRIAARVPGAGATSKPDNSKNGRWFVVLASGPTGPVDSVTRQFGAHSDQDLKLFVLDLKTGQKLRTIGALYDGTIIPNAFGGSLLGGKVDYDLDYQDDVLYFGYIQKCAATNKFCTADTNTWSDGGILRLSTREDLSSLSETATALNPGNWKLSSVMSNIGPVSAAVANLVERSATGTAREGWLYYGTGRYFFRDDDSTNQRILFGVKEPCILMTGGFEPDPAVCAAKNFGKNSLKFCDSPIVGANGPDTCEDLYNVTVGVELDPAIYKANDFRGWYIGLESPTNTNIPAGGLTTTNITPTAERVMTDPIAVPNGAVFFTTFAPVADICSFGGNTFLWRLKYNTGSFIPMSGTALLQLSTGEIKELDMRTAFADKIATIDSDISGREGQLEGPQAGRRTGAMTGVPPVGQGLSLVISPTPIDKILHIKKR